MSRPLRTTYLWAVCCALVACAVPASAAIVPLTSGISLDEQMLGPVLVQDVTGIQTPGGKQFSSLTTAHHTQLHAAGGRTAGIGWDTGDFGDLTGSADNLRANVIVIGNGYGFIDLTMFDGSQTFVANDADRTQQDFMLMDHLGNDDFAISAILADGTIGARVDFRSSDFGQQPGLFALSSDTFHTGQLLFDITDLRDDLGRRLPVDAELQGLRIYENTRIPPTTGGGNGLDLIMLVADVRGTVPEPTTAALAAMGLLAVCGARRRK